MPKQQLPERVLGNIDVIKSRGGILPLFEIMYIKTIDSSAKMALEGFSDVEEAYMKDDFSPSVFDRLYSGLIHCGALSRMFWPPRPRLDMKGLEQERAARLRDLLDIPEGSLLQQRDLRNTLEHFEEKLDVFLAQGHPGVHYPEPIVGRVFDIKEPHDHVYKFVDHHDRICVILGQKFSYAGIDDELRQIRLRCAKIVKKQERL